MPIGKYRVITFGKQFSGASDSHQANVSAVAKQNGPGAPYCIPNEMICAEIGRFLGLPLPPWGIVEDATVPGASWFATLDFNLTGNDLPPIDPPTCCATFPDLIAGLLLFDTLIANGDRHPKNLSTDMLSRPPRMSVFDHSHALFGFVPGEGVRRLIDLRERLGMSGGPHTHGNRHCLLDGIDTDDSFGKWLDRIDRLPNFTIDDVCVQATDFGITPRESKAARGFLKGRRDGLRKIIKAHRAEFHSIKQWRLFP